MTSDSRKLRQLYKKKENSRKIEIKRDNRMIKTEHGLHIDKAI
jgi:hypothetical protein